MQFLIKCFDSFALIDGLGHDLTVLQVANLMDHLLFLAMGDKNRQLR